MLKKPIITKKNILEALKKSGLKKGDTIFVHSSLGGFGWVKEVSNKTELANLAIDCFLEIIGKKGTMVVPTFTYSFTKKEIFNVKNTPSTVGTLTEVFRKRKNTIRSIHPIFSIAATGPKKEFLVSNLDKTSFGKNSAFQRLLDINAKQVFYGVDRECCTFIHLIERRVNVPYRFEKKFSGEIIVNGSKYNDTYTYYVRYLNKNVISYFTRFQIYLENTRTINKVKLGKGYIRVINTKRLYEEGIKMLKKDIYFFLKEKP